IGVEFIRNDISYRVYANKEVIVSGGPINSPQLLMLSGIGPKQHLQNIGIPVILDLPVGNNFANHPAVTVSVNMKDEYLNMVNPVPDPNVQQLSQLYYHQSGPLSQNPSCALYYNTHNNSDNQWPNALLFGVLYNNTINIFSNLVRYKSRGILRLQSTDPYIPPLIDPNWLSHPDDREDLLEATRHIFYILERTSISRYILPPADLLAEIGCPVCPGRYTYECTEGLKCFVQYYSTTSYHPGGSCRMGSIDRSDVVVDPQLRVKNMKNLRVCDSSIFPTIPNSNTAALTITVGYKCAQFIKDCYHLK
ncbi:unnamed protein product, partial [Oppiella nova]